jgi:uncharacterized protein involved in exopolysaccharide biosynthesis/Mrp family chromosome partitioning ATPase
MNGDKMEHRSSYKGMWAQQSITTDLNDLPAIPPPRGVLHVLWAAKWPVLTAALLGGLFAGIAALARSPLYESKSQLIVSVSSTVSGTTGAIASQEATNEAIDGHLAVLMSEAHVRRVISGLSAKAETAVLSHLSKEGDEPGVVESVESALNSGIASVRWRLGWSGTATYPTLEDKDAALVQSLQRGLRVGQELRSRVIGVGFSDKDPGTAMIVANAFAQTYMDYLEKKRRAALEADLAELDQRIPQIQGGLVSAIRRMEDFNLMYGISDRQGSTLKLEELLQLRQALARTNSDLSAGASEVSDFAKQQRQLLSVEGSALQDRIAQLETDFSKVGETTSQARALEMLIEAEVDQFKSVLAKRNSVVQRLRSPESSISILSAASMPTDPKTISPVFLVPPGMVLFGLLAAVAVVLRRNFDESLHSRSEVETALGVPLAGLLPKIPKVTALELQRLMHDEPATVYRRAVTSILISTIGASTHQVVSVTSSASQESKTELAWSLALAGRRMGRSVLFIDLDTGGDNLTKDFRAKLPEGQTVRFTLADETESNSQSDDFIAGRQVALYFMAPQRSADFLAKFSVSAVRHNLNKLRNRYDLVVINSPAVIDVPEAGLLTRLVDNTLFLIGSGQTDRHVAEAALRLIAGPANDQSSIYSVLSNAGTKISASLNSETGFKSLLRER